jgi:hypothetical protein
MCQKDEARLEKLPNWSKKSYNSDEHDEVESIEIDEEDVDTPVDCSSCGLIFDVNVKDYEEDFLLFA